MKEKESQAENVEELKAKLVARIKNLSLSFSYEEIGLFPRSFSRVLDRFFKQLFADVENLVIEEYRFYRYLFLTTIKCLLLLIFVPFLVNVFAKSYFVHPLIEYFWNQPEQEIFLNSYQEKRAFAELNDYEEKLYFESLILPASISTNSNSNHTNSTDSENPGMSVFIPVKPEFWKALSRVPAPFGFPSLSPVSGNDIAFSPVSGRDTTLSPASASETKAGESGEGKKKSETRERDATLTRRGDSPSDETINSLQMALRGSKTTLGKAAERSEKILRGLEGSGLSRSEKALSELKQLVISQQTGKGDEFRLGDSQKETSKKEVFEQRLQEKTMELATHYNNLSIEALTNFFADLLSLFSVCYLLVALDLEITVTKSFLLEVFFGLDDTRKSLFILLITDLLVGYHSSNLWELFFEFLFNHYGLPENQTSIFLLVATLPVLLDVLFKYIIFRHLNRSSPATVATYHAMIE